MDRDIRIVSTNPTEGSQWYIERRLHCPWVVSALAAEPVLRPGEKRGASAAMSDFGKYETLNAASRDPEDRVILQDDRSQIREKMLDKTLADSFPASDPPSSTPDPTEEDSFSTVSP